MSHASCVCACVCARPPFPPLTTSRKGFKEIDLQYRDDNGRVLTKQEAFRQLCYKFHGIQPSKKKTDIRNRTPLRSLSPSLPFPLDPAGARTRRRAARQTDQVRARLNLLSAPLPAGMKAEEHRLMSMAGDDTPLNTAATMRQAQARTGQAHVVLQGNGVQALVPLRGAGQTHTGGAPPGLHALAFFGAVCMGDIIGDAYVAHPLVSEASTCVSRRS